MNTYEDIKALITRLDSIANAPVSEDANEQEIIQYAKKYSQYKNLENDNLIEALYNFYLKDGIPQFMFEKGELASAEQKLGKKQDTWTGEEIEEAQKMSPITMGLINDLNKMIPGDSMEEKLEKMRKPVLNSQCFLLVSSVFKYVLILSSDVSMLPCKFLIF